MQTERMGFRGLALVTAAVVAGCLAPTTTVQPVSGPYRLQALPSASPAVQLVSPADPQPPYPYQLEEVRIPNPTAGIKLAGTLSMPRGRGPFPAAIIINGSGKATRSTLNQYKQIVDRLTRSGIAVLRTDTRGFGASGGNNATSTSADIATDVAAELAYLQRHPGIDPARVGLMGHSEGGMIAPMVASRHKVAFVVLLAAPGVSYGEIVERQVYNFMGLLGMTPTKAEVASMTAARLALRTERDPARRAVEAGKLLGPMLRKNARGVAALTVPQWKEKVQAMANRPWYRFALSYDPRPYLAQVKAPVLVMNGTWDVLVSATPSVPAIVKALVSGGNRQVTVGIYPRLNHFFQRLEPGYNVLGFSVMAPDALKQLADWVVTQTRQPADQGEANGPGAGRAQESGNPVQETAGGSR